MKKFIVWATMAALLTAGSAFAAGGRNFVAQPDATFTTGSPATTNNDDSCDIGVTPAATLLLPYFEVELNESAATANTTLFTVTNVSRVPQIAHVTVWTDWSFPVLDFNIFLTGYDVQAINLYDVIARGIIAPTATGAGTSITTPRGTRSQANTSGLFNGTVTTDCTNLPGNIPGSILNDMRTALTTGRYSTCSSRDFVGANHPNQAIGYITIDVSSACSTTLPTDSSYYVNEINFDNVLIGDYQQVDPNAVTGNFAGGNPLVHIRAIPDGNGSRRSLVTNLPYTFYDRYTPALQPTLDRRQPLPSTFAGRYINGGTGNFNTEYKIWREGVTGDTTCVNADLNADLGVVETVRFDEHENWLTRKGGVVISPATPTDIVLPETSATNANDTDVFPDLVTTAGDVGGWMYMNLDNQFYSDEGRASQNWVIVNMSAEGRYAVDFDAAWLGNGCSPAEVVTDTTNNGSNPIAPAADFNPIPVPAL